MTDRSGLRGFFCYHRRGGPLALAPGLAADLGWAGNDRVRPPGMLDLFAAISDADRVRVFLALHASERRGTPLVCAFHLREAKEGDAPREVTLEGTWTRGPDGEAETLFGSLRETGGAGEALLPPDAGHAGPADRIVALAVEIGEIARAHGVAAVAQSANHLLMQMVEKADAFAPEARLSPASRQPPAARRAASSGAARSAR